MPPTEKTPVIAIRGAEQNNLKNLDVDIPLGKFTVVTGLSGSGKSSLVFDTLYAEGQRRYVETFSPYARQFLDRMDHPRVGSIEGVPPAIAIDQNAVVRTSRSTVGTMTEINDRLKLLYARCATPFCPKDGSAVQDFSSESIWDDFLERLSARAKADTKVAIGFKRFVPKVISLDEARAALSAQGFTRILSEEPNEDGVNLLICADRFRSSHVERTRAIEAIEIALRRGEGRVELFIENDTGSWQPFAHYKLGRACPECGLTFSTPSSGTFSFNSPVGACPECRGFGRVISTDMGLVIPDRSRSLEEDAVKPFSTASFRECKDDMLRACHRKGIPTSVPYGDLSLEARRFIEEGDSAWKGDWKNDWYGIGRFFEWLESKSYKMHVRVMLSRYRAYQTCPTCGGARLRSEALYWRIGTLNERKATETHLGKTFQTFVPIDSSLSEVAWNNIPGFNFHELMLLPISALLAFLKRLRTDTHDEAESLILDEALSRLSYLVDVGLGYLTLDRQSRTLSGGEVQRVNLTTALGTNLVNTLFVLDEPSIGLHPRDMDRVNSILRRLTTAGNTLVVVEHDPQVMLAGDRLIDLGPGAGTEGGHIIYEGDTRGALEAQTLTGDYLSGKKRITRKTLPVTATTPKLHLEHADINNLKDISVTLPLKHLISVVGVSGSGKSSLISDSLVPALKARLGGVITAMPEEDENTDNTVHPSGGHARLSGDIPADIEFIDQSSLGKTTRGNPASYLGIFTGIRSIFGTSPEAMAAGVKPGDFSFNSGAGRCPRCGGTGTEHVEMQFLSDVYLSCPACRGTRYLPHILSIRSTLDDGIARNISDVLNLTVSEAIQAFARHRSIAEPLGILRMTGLGYLKLGQPLTTLSGGERQRLKLAARIADGIRGSNSNRLFVFDEPTTGLHFADVAKLVEIFDTLIRLGNTVVVIEHNLDVIGCSDWVIELGPEGGTNGGEVVFTGDPATMCEVQTLTGQALSAWHRAQSGEASRTDFFNLKLKKAKSRSMQALWREKRAIVIEGAREHNLQNLSVDIPHNAFTVITGPSGSGKSTVAFDIVFAEGQRRYLESLNAYARSMVQPPPAPEVDAVRGIPPTVAIEQRTTRGGMRSTVATMTEIYPFLRLLFTKLGTERCPDCLVAVNTQTPSAIAVSLTEHFPRQRVALFAPIVTKRKGIFEKEFLRLQNKGIKTALVDGRVVDLTTNVPKLARNIFHTIEAQVCTLDTATSLTVLEEDIRVAFQIENTHALRVAPISAVTTGKDAPEGEIYSLDRACPLCGRSLPEPDPRLFSYNSEMGACPTCSGYGVLTPAIRKAVKKKEAQNEEISETEAGETTLCPDCLGARLNTVARSFLWQGHSIQDICGMTVSAADRWFTSLQLDERSALIARDALLEIRSRIAFLQKVGLDYLTLDRSAPTLSGGETQRIHLASQLGTNLRGVCYVLDEPTIGLHPRDNAMLLDAIHSLSQKGNTLIVVEHDEETIRSADHVIDIGPGSGIRGGHLVAQGTVSDIEAVPESPTGRLLAHPIFHSGIPVRSTSSRDPQLVLTGIRHRNLAIDRLDIPLGRLVVVTGVSGSGKSTLCRDIVRDNLVRLLDEQKKKTGAANFVGLKALSGLGVIERVLEVDQTPIGRNPRSCPATYVGVMTAIREIFANAPEALERGFDASRFSFNRPEGACPVCGGQGMRTVEMNFLPDMKVTCEGCAGMRFNPQTLAVTWKGRSIGEVLQMEIDEAAEFFAAIPAIAHPLLLLKDVGLGYLTLGQPSPTLSGGEAQRIKLVTELAKVRPGSTSGNKTLYVLDEPTVGLHMADVERLTQVLSRLVDAGSTVLVIEHNLDVIAEADWIIDLGPEGGAKGGHVVAKGTPVEVAKTTTATGRALAEFLQHHQMH